MIDDELPNLIAHFKSTVQDVRQQQHEMQTLIDTFHHQPQIQPLSVPAQPENEVDVAMLKEELKIYQTFEERYDATINKIAQSNQIQIDNLVSRLMTVQTVEQQYQQINDGLLAQIEQLETDNQALKAEREGLKGTIQTLQNENQQKDQFILGLSHLNEGGSTRAEQYRLKRTFKNIELLRSENRKLHKENKFLQKQSMILAPHGDSTCEVQFWREKCESFMTELEKVELKAYTLEQKLKRRPLRPQPRLPQQETSRLVGEILEENRQLKQALQRPTNDISVDEFRTIKESWPAIERYILQHHLQRNPDIEILFQE